MREDELRSILLVKAIEEADREATLIPAADRISASREARRAGEGDAYRMLATRARALLAKVLVRHPFVEDIVRHAGGVAWIGWLAVAAAFLAGLALSALDGTRRINVLAFPLLGLVLWNLLVYVFVVVAALRRHSPSAFGLGGGGGRGGGRWLSSVVTQSTIAQLSALIAKSKSFNAPLAEALARFLREWQEAARPLLTERAVRMLHFAAAAAGGGLVAGLYLRGIAFDYRAGWESTFLDAARARSVLSLLYGPASWLTGIPIPDAAHLEAIRWREGGGGESAARWIHLLAATALLFVIIPRLVLALIATFRIARWSRRAPVPVSLASYARIAFSGVGGLVDRGIVMVVPFAYEPAPNSLARLRTVLGAEMGEHLAIDLRAPVRYGDEDAFVRNVGDQGGRLADVVVLLASLAATPEEENHGLVIEGVRDWMAQHRPQAQLVVIVDEGPYAARVPVERVEERRRAWQAFIAARGVEPRFMNLAP
jgi:hypothetical protein